MTRQLGAPLSVNMKSCLAAVVLVVAVPAFAYDQALIDAACGAPGTTTAGLICDQFYDGNEVPPETQAVVLNRMFRFVSPNDPCGPEYNLTRVAILLGELDPADMQAVMASLGQCAMDETYGYAILQEMTDAEPVLTQLMAAYYVAPESSTGSGTGGENGEATVKSSTTALGLSTVLVLLLTMVNMWL